MAPTVSIIIPIYLGENYIERTINSIQAQIFKDFEILCVDDHSPDSSRMRIENLSKRDSRIRYFRTPTNLGIVPKVMNFVAHQVRGRFFVYSSQDDTFSDNWLGSMVEVAERTGADAVVPNLLMVDNNRGAYRKLINDWREPVSGEEAFFLSLDWTIPGNALWPSRFLREGGFADFGTYADEYTARTFFLECRTVAFAKGEFYYFHGNPDSITKKLSGRLLDDTYNNYRIWRLVRERFAGHQWDAKLAGKTLRSLMEAEQLILRHPELRREQTRLEPAIAGMKKPDFLASLREYLRRRPLAWWVARLAIRSRSFRRVAVFAHYVGRGSKLQLLGFRRKKN